MTTKPWWARLCERVARKYNKQTALPERPVANPDANAERLARLGDDDPTYRALMDYAFVEFENNVELSLRAGNGAEARITYSDRAAGVLGFIEKVEADRGVLRADYLRKLKKEEKK